MQDKTSFKTSKSVKSRWRLLCSPKSGAKSYTKTTIYSIYTLAQVVFSISFLFKDNSGKNLLKLKLQHHKNTSNFPPPLQTRPSTTSALYQQRSASVGAPNQTECDSQRVASTMEQLRIFVCSSFYMLPGRARTHYQMTSIF